MKKPHHKRKQCICSRCSKEKMHFGNGMCSACIRKTKRETKPSYYLGTCYSEMSRRVKTFDPIRPNYFGKSICTKDEFFEKFLTDDSFLKLFYSWQESGFKRKHAPSIDRIDNDKDYTLDNMQFISQSENSIKASQRKVIDNEGVLYDSIKECANINNKSSSCILKAIKNNKKINSKEFKYYENS